MCVALCLSVCLSGRACRRKRGKHTHVEGICHSAHTLVFLSCCYLGSMVAMATKDVGFRVGGVSGSFDEIGVFLSNSKQNMEETDRAVDRRGWRSDGAMFRLGGPVACGDFLPASM